MYENEKVKIPNESIVLAIDELLPLCPMCSHSRFSCENSYIREVEVPLLSSDSLEDELIIEKRINGNEFEKLRTGVKTVDGVEYGIYKNERDVPIPFVCEWFQPKNNG